jgi:hypothetical protein
MFSFSIVIALESNIDCNSYGTFYVKAVRYAKAV